MHSPIDFELQKFGGYIRIFIGFIALVLLLRLRSKMCVNVTVYYTITEFNRTCG